MKTKKIIKWAAIAIGSLLVLTSVTMLSFYFFFFKADYNSGGILSENQKKYDVTYYDINLEIQLENKTIAGNTKVKFFSVTDSLRVLELDLIDHYIIDKITIDGLEAESFSHNNDKLWITSKTTFTKNILSEINIYYSGNPPEAKRPPWRGGFTWSQDSSGNHWVGLSCQGEGGKIWFPCKDHPSDEPDSAAINITVPNSYFVASNGLLKNRSVPRDSFTTYHWFTGYTINNYLINFQIGKYEEVSTEYQAEDGTIVPVVFYVLPEYKEGAIDLVNETVDMLHSYRKFFGEYPWIKEKCALVTTPFKGMEHQTLISYGNRYQYTHVFDFEYDELLLHELAHEWWGNKITVKDWSDFWMQEGFATYAEALYVLDKAGEEAYHENIRRNRIRNWWPIKSELNSSTEEAYQPDIYSKGAAFLHTLRYILGDSVFFPTLKQFATDSAYTYKNLVEMDDFLQLVNKNSQKDYSKFFDLYLLTTDLPEIKIDSVASNRYQISIPNIDFELPMDVAYNDTSKQMVLGPKQITLESNHWPVVDEMNWYLKETDD